MKLTIQQIDEIKQLAALGEPIRAIAVKFSVSHSTIAYHLDKETKKLSRKKWWDNLSRDRKKEVYDKRKEYCATYMRNKYNTDAVFRENKKAMVSMARRKKDV